MSSPSGVTLPAILQVCNLQTLSRESKIKGAVGWAGEGSHMQSQCVRIGDRTCTLRAQHINLLKGLGQRGMLSH